MRQPQLLIVGGGPCGLMAGLLFARAGVNVHVIEKHGDFLHDFRGDTVHPSTMDVLGQLGLLETFLARPHQRLHRAELRIAGEDMVVGDLTGAPTRTPFVAMMPQWEFLDFLRSEAAKYANFRLDMGREVDSYLVEKDRIAGIRLKDGRHLHSDLTIAADGRRSIVRRDGLLPVRDLGSPIDVFWFELPKRTGEAGALRIAVDSGCILVRVDRGSYWQCAFVLPKGGAKELKAKGLEAISGLIEAVEPRLGPVAADLRSVDDLHLLEVTLDRLDRWYRPGLLAIGDAAHAMSPMGGIGINLAIQDAVAASNQLAARLSRGKSVDHLLAAIQRRRQGSTQVIQFVQKLAQDYVLAPMLQRRRVLRRPPFSLRLLSRFPKLRRLPGRVIALGLKRESVQIVEMA